MVGERQFAVIGSEAAGGAAGNFGFAEFGVGKRDRERVDSRAGVTGERGDGSGVNPAAEEDADGNIGYKMGGDGALEQRANVPRGCIC